MCLAFNFRVYMCTGGVLCSFSEEPLYYSLQMHHFTLFPYYRIILVFLLIHSLTDSHFHSFYQLAIVNSAVMYVCGHAIFNNYFFQSFRGVYTSRRIFEPYVNSMHLYFGGNAKLFYTQSPQLYTSKVEGFQFLNNLTTICYFVVVLIIAILLHVQLYLPTV